MSRRYRRHRTVFSQPVFWVAVVVTELILWVLTEVLK